MCFRHIELSFILIDKDVKIGEKFHERQLFGGAFRSFCEPSFCAKRRNLPGYFAVRAGGFEKTVFFLASL